MKLTDKQIDRFQELYDEMWTGDCGSCGPSYRILLDDSGEIELRTEPGSLHSWYVPNSRTIASRDSGTEEEIEIDWDAVMKDLEYYLQD